MANSQDEPGKAKRTRGLKPFVKGDPRINRDGRPRRFLTVLQSGADPTNRLTYDDVRAVMETLMTRTTKELKDLCLSDEALIYEKVIAHAILSDDANGRLDNVEIVLSRLYGRPKENLNLNMNKAIVKTYRLPMPDFTDAEVIVPLQQQMPQNGTNGNGKAH